jgi:hypothetical protein
VTAGLAGEQLLAVWEQGRGVDALTRALLVWSAADSLPVEDLAAAPLGVRDLALLEVRRQTFGAVADCYVACPRCGDGLEFALDVRDLVPGGTAVADDVAAGSAVHELWVEDWDVRFRLPGSRDLRVASQADHDLRAAVLLEAAVVSVERAGIRCAVQDLPSPVVEALDAELARLDPAADLTLELRCAACSHAWPSRFDVGAFLWREIEVNARRLLQEVDALARTYGWSERDILSLPATRRRSYLDLAGWS